MRLELLHELARIETLAEHHERRRTEDRGVRIEALVRLYDFQRIVLRLEAADVQDVISFRETETREDVAVVFDRKLGAVWNHDRFDCVVVAIIARDHFRVRDHAREVRGEGFANCVRGAAENVPLATLAFDAVDVDRDRNARRAQEGDSECVDGVAKKNDVEVATQRIERGEKSVAHRFEVLAAECRKDDAMNAVPHSGGGEAPSPVVRSIADRLGRRSSNGTAVDGHVVSARNESRSQLRGKRLESAVRRRHAARSGDGDFHRNHLASSRSPTRRRR